MAANRRSAIRGMDIANYLIRESGSRASQAPPSHVHTATLRFADLVHEPYRGPGEADLDDPLEVTVSGILV